MDFWTRLDKLLNSSELVIDRPKGSNHPKYPNIIYPLDYGYLSGTSGGNGKEIDVWCGSGISRNLVAIVCTVDTLKNDTELKLLLGCTEEEIEIVNQFHNDNQYMSGLIIKRP
jgi:inorganic pyrophosphatase